MAKLEYLVLYFEVYGTPPYTRQWDFRSVTLTKLSFNRAFLRSLDKDDDDVEGHALSTLRLVRKTKKLYIHFDKPEENESFDQYLMLREIRDQWFGGSFNLDITALYPMRGADIGPRMLFDGVKVHDLMPYAGGILVDLNVANAEFFPGKGS